MKRLLLLVLLMGTLASAQQLPQLQNYRAPAERVALPDLHLFGPLSALSQTSAHTKSFSFLANADASEPVPLNPVLKPVKTPEVSPFHKKIFVAEVVAYTVPNILDGITTIRGVRRGFTEEPFPRGAAELLGNRPGVVRYTLVMGGIQAAVTFASYKLEHSQSRTLRFLGHSLMVKRSVDHTVCFVNNLTLGPAPGR
jgi:hypothetical protein